MPGIMRGVERAWMKELRFFYPVAGRRDGEGLAGKRRAKLEYAHRPRLACSSLAPRSVQRPGARLVLTRTEMSGGAEEGAKERYSCRPRSIRRNSSSPRAWPRQRTASALRT